MKLSDFKQLTQRDIKHFVTICGQNSVVLDKPSLEQYGSDETEDLNYLPEVVLKPSSVEEVSDIMKYCFEQVIPVTPRGAGTGLSGGSIPKHGGVSLSLEKMNQILDLDEKNFQITVEPSVITQVLQEYVAERSLFYPPDPASKGSCFIVGNIAENSGGPKAVKYGVTKDYVLNLQVVLANGAIIWTGANVLKNATGYNLTQLIVGSEGTLGVVTKAVLRLIPLPKYDKLMLVPFYSSAEACEAVAAIFHHGLTPSGLEFMEKDALALAQDYLGSDSITLEVGIEAHLLIEVDGNNEAELLNDMESIVLLLEKYKVGEILFADTASQKEKLWKARRCLGEAVKKSSIYKEEDTVVPRAKLPDLLHGIKEIGKRYNFRSVCYGHAGDGNLHVNILKDAMDDFSWNNTIKLGIREIFTLCKKLGGTISGEHGIGLVQKEYIDIVFSPSEIDLQKAIKTTFDSKGILNPGKMF